MTWLTASGRSDRQDWRSKLGEKGEIPANRKWMISCLEKKFWSELRLSGNLVSVLFGLKDTSYDVVEDHDD